MKRALSLLLTISMLTSLCAVLAVDAGKTRAVIGADLTQEQIAAVYESFGAERGDAEELRVTNADERKYLEGYVDEGVIGTRSISCVYIETLEEGEGLDVTTSNISWCQPEMYVSALATAGITDARVIVAAPFEVSGTAALTGVYMAYEDITGQKLDETAKLVSTQELTVTAGLADQIGALDSVEIVNQLKLILDQTKAMSAADLWQKIKDIAAEYNVTLTDAQLQQLVELCRQLERLDADALREKVESIQDTLEGLAQARTKVQGFAAAVRSIFSAIGEFFAGIAARLRA